MALRALPIRAGRLGGGADGLGREVGFQASFADFGTQRSGQAEEVGGGLTMELSRGEFSFDPAKLLRQAGEFVLVRGEDLLLDGFKFDSAQGANLGIVLAAPIHEGALGDCDLGSDAGEAPAFGPKFKETTFGIH